MGIVKELNERGLLPRIINGASAGSLITAAIGSSLPTLSMTDFHIRVRTDVELDEMDEHTIARLDHFKFDWMNPGRSTNWKIRHTLKSLLPESSKWIVDACFGVLIDGRSPYKLDVNRLIEVSLSP